MLHFVTRALFVHIPTPVDVSLDSGWVQLPEPESPKSSKVIHFKWVVKMAPEARPRLATPLPSFTMQIY